MEEWPRPCGEHREPFCLGRLEKAQRKVITDLIGVRARYSRVSFHFRFLLHAERKIREDGAGNQELRVI